MGQVSPPLRRLLALTILVVAAAGLWLFVVQPVRAKFEAYHDSIEQSRTALGKYQRSSSARAELEQRLEEARRVQAAKGEFLKGDSVELVAADLQNTVKTLVEANGGKLKSIQSLPQDDEENGFGRVAIRVNMTADTEALLGIFHAIETANPYLFLNNVSVRGPRLRYQRRTSKDMRPQPQAIGNAELRVRYDVYGYMGVTAS